MATITAQPIEEQVLYWVFQHLDYGRVKSDTGGVQSSEPRPDDLTVRRSRRAAVGKDDGTIVNITPQATRPDDGEVNAGWTTTGRSRQRWEMDVEISVARAKWPSDATYGVAGSKREDGGYAAESSVAEVVKWIQARLRPNYFEGATEYPPAGGVKGDLISDASLDEIRWAFADRDQGEVVALMRYRIEYHLG